MPTKNQIHLKPWMSMKTIHKEYVQDCIDASDPYLCYPRFTTLWKDDFSAVVIPAVSFIPELKLFSFYLFLSRLFVRI